MNILLVIADLGLGGAQQVVINLANELVRQGHSVWIYDIYPELRKEGMIQKNDSGVHLIDPEFEKIPFHQKGLNSILYRSGLNKHYLENARKKAHRKALGKVLNENKIDAVNSHVFWADEFVLNELEDFHDRWWVTLHASYSQIINAGNIEKLRSTMFQILNSAKGVIHIADEEQDSIHQYFKEDFIASTKIYNGLPLHTVNTIKERDDSFNILCASRAIKAKGWEELINAVKHINDPKISLIFAGDGPDLEYFKTISNGAKNIEFLGFCDNIETLIQEVHVVILPSYTEKLPTIILESLFGNRPIISTNVGEVNNMIANTQGKCGIVIPASKGEELSRSLVNAINEIKGNYEQYTDLKAYSRVRNDFSVETMAKNYLSLFQNH